jgi:hypothetical protein
VTHLTWACMKSVPRRNNINNNGEGVGIAESLLRSATAWTAGVRFHAGVREFYVLHNVQTGSDALPASYPMGTGVPSPEAKRPGREADLSSSSSVEVKNGGALPPFAD